MGADIPREPSLQGTRAVHPDTPPTPDTSRALQAGRRVAWAGPSVSCQRWGVSMRWPHHLRIPVATTLVPTRRDPPRAHLPWDESQGALFCEKYFAMIKFLSSFSCDTQVRVSSGSLCLSVSKAALTGAPWWSRCPWRGPEPLPMGPSATARPLRLRLEDVGTER